MRVSEEFGFLQAFENVVLKASNLAKDEGKEQIAMEFTRMQKVSGVDASDALANCIEQFSSVLNMTEDWKYRSLAALGYFLFAWNIGVGRNTTRVTQENLDIANALIQLYEDSKFEKLFYLAITYVQPPGKFDSYLPLECRGMDRVSQVEFLQKL